MTLRTEEGRWPKQPSWWAARQIKGPAHTRGDVSKGSQLLRDYSGEARQQREAELRCVIWYKHAKGYEKSSGLNIAEQTYADEFRKAWKLAGIVRKLSQPPSTSDSFVLVPGNRTHVNVMYVCRFSCLLACLLVCFLIYQRRWRMHAGRCERKRAGWSRMSNHCRRVGRWKIK